MPEASPIVPYYTASMMMSFSSIRCVRNEAAVPRDCREIMRLNVYR
jgi:hypothetical protein